MPQLRVRDVMTTEVITVPDDASVAEIVAVLTDRQITAVPIVDRFDVVLGVVSWTDLRKKIDIAVPEGQPRASWWHRWAPPLVQWPQGTAVEVMSGPALTIGADASLMAAARVMYRSEVGRLLVVDRDSRLRGIVTRSDLLKVHDRLDAVIRDEVMHRVLRRTLMIPPGEVQAAVDDGVVTLTGRTARKSTAVAAARLTEAVPGVTDVVDRLAFDVDDTIVAAPASQAAERDPLRGWWIGRPPARSAGRTAGDRLADHEEQTVTRSAALQMTGQPAGPPPSPMTWRPKRVQHGVIVDLLERTPEGSGHLPDTDDDFGGFAGDIVDEWGRQSFPASDPPANW